MTYAKEVRDMAVAIAMYNGENLPYVALCESLGIFSGGTEFNGNSPITRGEFAQLLYNFIDIYYNYTGNSLL